MLTGDSQLRWLGPEKGVIHLATAALVNAVWDLWAKREGKPLWRAARRHDARAARRRCIDFRYLTDVLDAGRGARAAARAGARREPTAIAELERDGYPAYTTSAGWLGYADDKIRALCREAIADGLDALQDEGRRAISTTTSAARADARGDRPTAC